MKGQKYLLSFLLTTSFISVSALPEEGAPAAVAPKVDRFGQRTSALMNKSAKLASETKRLKLDREERQDRSKVAQAQSSEAKDLYTKFEEAKKSISVLDSAADRMFPTIDDEDLAFKALMGDHEREKQAIVEKEALYQTMDVQFSDDTVITVRRDVLNLCPLLQQMLEDDDEGPLPLPYPVSHAAARKLFFFLEATLTPGVKRPLLWSVPESGTVIDFLKLNKDLIFTLNFLQLLPKEYSNNLNNPSKMYGFQWSVQEDGTLYPQYLKDGFKYDPSVRPTAETMQFIIEEEALRAFPAIEQSHQRALELYIKTLDDMKVILSFPVDILQEAFHIKEVILTEPDLVGDAFFCSLADDIISRNFGLQYRDGSLFPPFSFTASSSDELVMYFPIFPEGPFKERMVDKLTHAQHFSIHYYQMRHLNGLPENVLAHLKKVMMINSPKTLEMLHRLNEILKKPEATRTQGENLVEAHYRNVLNSMLPKEIGISTIRDLETLDQLPVSLLQCFIFFILPRSIVAELESQIAPNMSSHRVQSLLRDLYAKQIRFTKEYREAFKR